MSDILDPFFILLAGFSANGVSLSRSKEILSSAKILLKLENIVEFMDCRNRTISKLENEISDLEAFITSGEIKPERKKDGIFFPVIEISKNPPQKFGSLERLEFIIEANYNYEDKFDIIPSTGLIEERLNNQIISSWKFAKNFVLGAKKQIMHFNVVIKFSQRSVDYTGDSLGAALTLGFIEQLGEILKLREISKVANRLAITGSSDENGSIGSVSDITIKHKLEAVFFSYVDVFVVPTKNYDSVLKSYTKLKEKYPKREIKIVRAENINEILLRRDLVSIKKQNLLFWAAKKANRPRYVFPLLFIMFIITAALIYRKTDDNPANVFYRNGNVVITNSLGEILWEKSVLNKNYFEIINDRLKKYIRLVDINNDGINEIIYQTCLLTNTNTDPSKDILVCMNNKFEILWEFSFYEKIRDLIDEYEDFFSEAIIDIYSNNGEFEILVGSQINKFYPNAMFRLNRFGERIGEILWHPGTVRFGAVRDIDSDNNLELIAVGINNGFEGAVLFSIDIENLNGRSPSVGKYRFPNYEIAEFDQYIQLPVSDYVRKLTDDIRYNSAELINFSDDLNEFSFNIIEELWYRTKVSYIMNFSNTFHLKDIVIADNFRVKRDSAIVGLDPNLFPLTDSKEFKQSLFDQIAYWNGKDFVNIHEWTGIQAGKVDSTTLY